MRDQARGRCCQDEGCGLDLSGQRRDSGLARGARRAGERDARRPCLDSSHGDPCDDQLVGDPQGRRKGVWVEPAEGMLGLIETTDQEQAPDLEILRMGRIHAVTVLFEYHSRRAE
jgi:hypothetical protein